jgi:hypothetical protein
MVASGNLPVHFCNAPVHYSTGGLPECTGVLPECTGRLPEIRDLKQLSDLFLRTIGIGIFLRENGLLSKS